MERSEVILTRLTKLTDSSFIVQWFSSEEGIIKTVAKGARRPKSPFAGKLDLFFSASIDWVRSRRSDLHQLREVSPLAIRSGIRRHYDATLLAAYFCRLLEAAVEREHPEPSIYDLLRRGLDHIEENGASKRALHYFEEELARLLGLSSQRRDAAQALRNALDGLPKQRQQILDRLAFPQKLPFADPDRRV